MAKIFKISDKNGIRVEPISINGENRISIRQVYKTVKEPDEWKIGFKGITIPAKGAAKLASHIRQLVEDETTEYKVIEFDQKDSGDKPKPATGRSKGKK